MYRCTRGLPKVRHFVDRFIEEHLRGAEVTPGSLITGSIPVTIAPRKLVEENIILVGDAARQVNPLTAGGIMNALEAADSAAKYLIARRASAPRILSDSYSRDWRKNQRRQHKLFMLLREIWFSTPDKKLLRSLQTVFSLTDFTLDRSKPFTLPLVPLFRFLMHVFPLTLKHIRILFK
jgi:digeranylgeranylglycerophospholipid reductase